MTGYESKKSAARDRMLDDDDTLTIAYQSGYYDGKKAAQPAQESVAHLCGPDENGLFGLPTADKACKDCFPVYRQSPQPAQEPWRESASDYERGVIDGRQMQAQSSVDKAVNRMAQPAQEPAIGDIRALKHRIHELEGEVIGYKQILDAQPEQEPVACVGTNGELMWLNKPMVIYSKPIPLYTAPPQRPWVGLTEQEFQLIYDMGRTPSGMMEMVENMLKDKNT